MRAVRRRKGPRFALLGLIAGLCAFAIPAVAQAQVQQGEPWACDNVSYMTQFDGENTDGDTLFLRADLLADGTVDLVELGRHEDINLNAIGFRAQDGFMYAMDRTNNEIVRIGQDANGAPVFTSIGLPPNTGIEGTVTGAVLADGTYMVWRATPVRSSTSAAIRRSCSRSSPPQLRARFPAATSRSTPLTARSTTAQ